MSMDLEGSAKEMRNLSVSKIEKALLCGYQFKFQYVDRIPLLSSGILLAGNVHHKIVENAIRTFARTGKYPDWKEMDDQFEPSWKAKVAEEEERPEFLGWKWDPGDPEKKVKEQYRQLIRVTREKALPGIRPWMIGNEPVVEYKIDIDLPSEVGPFRLLGYLDLLEEHGILIDWKTTEDEVSKRQKKTWLQFAGYSLWAYPIVGEEELRCEKVFLIRGTKPDVQRVPFVVGRAHRAWFVKVAAAVWKMVKSGVFLPNTEGWWCGPKYCDFFRGCRGEIPGEVPEK